MFLLLQGKMKLSSLILIIVLVRSKCIKFVLELQNNVLKFGYGINYKYEGMLTHSFNRFYIITKFILPSIGDIRFSHLNFDDSCSYMNKEYAPNTDSSKYLKELKTYCNMLKPFVSYYFKLIKSYNNTVYDILENKVKPLLPKMPRQKCGLVTTLVSGFIDLAYEGISSFLQRKWDNGLKKTIFRLLYTNNLEIQQYAFNLLLFLRIIQDKYISLYRELIT